MLTAYKLGCSAGRAQESSKRTLPTRKHSWPACSPRLLPKRFRAATQANHTACTGRYCKTQANQSSVQHMDIHSAGGRHERGRARHDTRHARRPNSAPAPSSMSSTTFAVGRPAGFHTQPPPPAPPPRHAPSRRPHAGPCAARAGSPWAVRGGRARCGGRQRRRRRRRCRPRGRRTRRRGPARARRSRPSPSPSLAKTATSRHSH